MPEEQILSSLPPGHRAQAFRVGIEITIALLVAIISYNARQITNDLERVVERLRLVEITIEGTRYQIDGINKRMDSFTRTQEVFWNELRELRGERMRR